MPSAALTSQRQVHLVLSAYLAIFLASTLGVWAWFLAHNHGTARFPLGDTVERFGDLIRFTSKHQYGTDPNMLDTEHLLGTIFPKNYQPLAVLIYIFLLQRCAPYAVVVFASIVVAGMVVASVALWRRARQSDAYRWYIGLCIFATGLFGWGTELTLMRANIEGIELLFILLGAYLYAKEHYSQAAVSFAIAICIKPFPILWLALLARHKKFREAGLGLLATAVLTLACLQFFDRNPIHAWHLIGGKSTFFSDYILAFRSLRETIGDHSLLQSMKSIVRVILNHGVNFGDRETDRTGPDNLAARSLLYLNLYLTGALVLLVVRRVWSMPTLNQIFTLACATTLLPLIANDYTLTILLVPMAFGLIFLLEDVAQGKVHLSTKQLLWYVLPCAWLMSTNPLWALHGVLKCAALFVLLGASITIPLPATMFKDDAPEPSHPQLESVGIL